jgi:hypothetical protein
MNNAPLRIFIGVDSRQPVAYTMAQTSIWRHASRPVAITPLVLGTLPITAKGLTEFSVSRYLVPWLCNFEGHALFIDGDTLCMGDVAELPWDSEHAVSLVPHDTVLKDGKQVDVRYERPSVMLFNCAKCTHLTPEYVQECKPHRLAWASSIGDLPREWNHLVGYDAPGPAKLAHFTMGLPCFEETAGDEYAQAWQENSNFAGSTCGWEEIMGGSVHARWKRKPAVNDFMRAQGFG